MRIALCFVILIAVISCSDGRNSTCLKFHQMTGHQRQLVSVSERELKAAQARYDFSFSCISIVSENSQISRVIFGTPEGGAGEEIAGNEVATRVDNLSLLVQSVNLSYPSNEWTEL